MKKIKDYSRPRNFFYKQLDPVSRWIVLVNGSVGGYSPRRNSRENKKWYASRLWFNFDVKETLADYPITLN